MQIREATPDDVSTMIRFIQELADFEQEPDAVQLTADALHEHLFGEPVHLFAHIAEDRGRPVGMAIWFLNFSTWEGTHGIYVEDLYVSPDARGAGAGRELLSALAGVCTERGYARLELSVLDWNEQAIGFYRRLGAVGMDEWTVQRIAGPALADLAVWRESQPTGQ